MKNNHRDQLRTHHDIIFSKWSENVEDTDFVIFMEDKNEDENIYLPRLSKPPF